MMSLALSGVLAFPDIGSTMIEVGPIAIRWYSMAYIVGILLGWRYMLRLIDRPGAPMARRHVDDFLLWATLGVILGGRIGYVLFYNFDFYLAHPADILKVWHGGMSFHGGMLGVTLAIILFCHAHKLNLRAFADHIACVVPIGLLLGRLANFVNGELYGRPTNVPWAMVFPDDPSQLPRHPSQLYEAALEGVVLFAALWILFHKTPARKTPGVITGVFFIGYGLARFAVEFVRMPDEQLGILPIGISMGQLLSTPMILFGAGLIAYSIWAKSRQQA